MDLCESGLSQFVCPGSAQSVTRAVHLARLNAAWPNCDECQWRHHSEGLAERTVDETDRVRVRRAEGIRRTEFGIRGQYINELDRRTAADLVRVFCHCFHEYAAGTQIAAVESFAGRRSNVPHVGDPHVDQIQPEIRVPEAIIVGYDDRSSSPDIVVGAVTSIREYGLPVIDIGRCTAASIQEAARAFPECAGAIFVTGAGQAASWTGLDAFDRNGDPLAVIWKDFGIRLQHVSIESEETPPPQQSSELADSGRDDKISELLQRLKDGEKSQQQSDHVISTRPALRLRLPDAEQRHAWNRRLTRRSGVHRVEEFEQRYHNWLTRWFPERCSMRVLVRCNDPLIRHRCLRLSGDTGLEMVVRSVHDDSELPSSGLTIIIAEDDREFSVLDARGRQVCTTDLAQQLNRAIRSRSSQVTAHADSVSGRFWLTDAGRPSAAGSTEHIRDSLAVLGMLVRLTEGGRLTLSGGMRS